MMDSDLVDPSVSQYVHNPGLTLWEEELDEKYPNRPRNHSSTLPFHDLHLTLFDPLNDNKKKPTGPPVARKKIGPHGARNNPQEIRQNIIERFISRWRKEVGNDIYPAFRLILPDKDRERAMYGLKEKTIGKLLISVMKINKDSEDGYNLLNWKQPGQSTISRMAGDFAGRCYEVISKRPMRTEVGNMTVGEVNDLMDKLAAAGKEEAQKLIFTEFYNKMNADELMWLIRIILRQMRIGATEKTIFNIWHSDADSLFNISSNLRRVCWELYNPAVRLEGDDRGITLMQCFQPQLAQFQMHSFQEIVDRMRPTEDDSVFWIEEKLDGERMQLHMISDDETPGGKKFAFWSRKAKDYTPLYGNGLLDENSSLTRHLKNAFDEGVDNVILDGEMITWDLTLDKMMPFGTLKTAALAQKANEFGEGMRPLFKVFDCLYLNGQALTNFTLRDRRRALQQAVKDVHRRMEIHTYVEATSVKEIDPLLRKVVAEASEGLVLKNPHSSYRLNDRNDDWMKVKPEYMNEFGENLDCTIIGGYYGSGKRGGGLSSYLCGLRVDENHVSRGANPMRFYSFFKVGGGFTAADYAAIRHATAGKWKTWDPKHPPTEYIALSGDHLQHERPDEWIIPSDSVVIEVKAASLAVTERFKMGFTLRFPRFKRLRSDRSWDDSLSMSDFIDLKRNVEKENKDKQFKIDDGRRKRQRVQHKKPITVAGSEVVLDTPYAGTPTKVFEGLQFFIMTASQHAPKKSKAELEALVKSHSGRIVQTESKPTTICIGDRRTVSVAASIKRGSVDIIRPSWLFDNIAQSETDGADRPTLILPLEPKHMFFTIPDSASHIESAVDPHGDAYARDLSLHDLQTLFANMPVPTDTSFTPSQFRTELEQHHHPLSTLRAWTFECLLLYPDLATRTPTAKPLTQQDSDFRLHQACTTARFGGAEVASELKEGVTHVLVGSGSNRKRVGELRERTARFERGRVPRVVRVEWVEECWREGTVVDEEGWGVV